MTPLNTNCRWCEDSIPEGSVFCDEDCRMLFIRRQTKEEGPPKTHDKEDLKWLHTKDIIEKGRRTDKRDRKAESDD